MQTVEEEQTVGQLSSRAIDASERAEQEHALRIEETRSACFAERQIALSLKVRDSLGIQVDPADVHVMRGEQTWLNAVVDVDDVTLATVGYLGVMKLHVLFRCGTCGSIKVSLHEVTDLESLGAVLRRPRSTETCKCRPGAEVWTTGGVVPS